MNRKMFLKGSLSLTAALVVAGSLHATTAQNISINGPRVVGTTPGKPFIFLIPVKGQGPFQFSATGLPQGLSLDAQQGIISGTVIRDGSYPAVLKVTGPQGETKSFLTVVAAPNSLALTPPMGWNSWNVWGCTVDEKKIRDAADLLVSTGLASHGFQYINIDDCWMGERDRAGKIQTNAKFGDMKRLADYVHSKGLKLGIYSSPGPKTCQGYAGSLNHEAQDAQTYAEWGVDYLKYDWCSYQGDAVAPYRLMGGALKNVSRDIVFSLCQYGESSVWSWAPSIGGNLWRTTGDISDSWARLSQIGFGQSGLELFSGPGHWNDPDMLVVGMLGGAWGETPHPSRLTQNEQITHISLWAMLAAPLLIGADLTQLDAFTMSLLTNDEVLAIDQDSLGMQAKKVSDVWGMQVWKRPLADGGTAMAVFNTSAQDQSAVLPLSEFANGISVRDLWKHQEIGKTGASLNATVPSHGAVMLKIAGSAN